jgi:hypothetical protein
MNRSKAKVVVNAIIQKIQMIVGVCWTIFVLIGSFGSIGSLGGIDIFMDIIFLSVGGLLIYFSIKRRKLAKTFKTYVQRLSFDKTGSIENLAIGLSTSQNIVKKNLKKLIDKKFFPNAYIDYEGNRVVFPSTSTTVQINIQQNINQEEIEYMAVACKMCGGVSKIQKEKFGGCDYCGSPIQ